MTALCLYRQSSGQPAGIVDLGGVEDVGYLADNPQIMQYFEAQEVKLLWKHDVILGLQSQLQPCTMSQPSQSVIARHQLLVGLMSPRKSPENYDDPRFHILSNMHTDDNEPNRGQLDDAGINEFLLQVDVDPSLLEQASAEEFLVVQLGSKMSPTKADNLAALGQLPIDSLAAVEMRAWAPARRGRFPRRDRRRRNSAWLRSVGHPRSPRPSQSDRGLVIDRDRHGSFRRCPFCPPSCFGSLVRQPVSPSNNGLHSNIIPVVTKT